MQKCGCNGGVVGDQVEDGRRILGLLKKENDSALFNDEI
jgi:hypothetical protein